MSLSGWSSPSILDTWLVTGGNALAKSIGQVTSDYLSYNFLPSGQNGQMWEERISANLSSPISYIGYLTFTTLNVTNGSNTNQRFSSLNFGTLSFNGTNYFNVTLKNEGNVTLPNVAMSSNAYRVSRFGARGTRNFTFMVADSSVDSLIYVSLNWTGASNYTLNLYNPSGNLVTTSSNYFINANVSGMNEELFNDTSSIAQGFWTLSVVNNTINNDEYNATAFVYSASMWISSNYTTRSLYPFTSNLTTVNITVPNTLDGNYEGQVFYVDGNNERISIPYFVNVTTPTIVFLANTTTPNLLNSFVSDTYRIDEDYNSTLMRVFYVNLTNLGSNDSIVTITNSSGFLTCTSCSSAFTANLTLGASPINVSSHGSQTINFNVSFNYSIPQGTYDGWILFNATNQTSALSSHPYSSYNLSVRLNLTNLLNVQVPLILSNNGDNIIRNVTTGENVTVAINVTYINSTLTGFGSQIQNVPVSNFTGMWLQEKNVTTSLGKIPSSSNFTLISGSGNANNPFCSGTCPPQSAGMTNLYYINFTVSPNQPGGQYAINSAVNYNRTSDAATFSGQGSNSTVIINNTGLFMSTNTSGVGCSFGSTCGGSASMSPSGTLTVYANIANYGPVSANYSTINYTTSCIGYTVALGTSSGCGTTIGSGATWTLNVPSYSTSCVVTWTLTAANSSSGSPNCAAAYLMGGNSTWFDPNGVNMTITVVNTSSNPNQNNNNNNNNNQGTPAAVYVSITNYPTIVYVVQNSVNSTIVTVKNVNNTLTQDIGLSIRNLTSSWYSITPSLQTAIAPFISTNYTITFSIPGIAPVADYLTNLTASTNYGSGSQLFTLRVLPSESTKVNINQTYQLSVVNYTNLLANVNQSKAMGMNTTQVEVDLSLAKAKLDQTQSYINSGDYFSAQQSLNQAQSLLTTATNDLANLKKNSFTGIFGLLQGNILYIAIGGIAIAAVFITYLFWPTKSEPLDMLIKPKAKIQESKWQKLKSKWSWENLKNKWKK